jgi:hypothetical protein
MTSRADQAIGFCDCNDALKDRDCRSMRREIRNRCEVDRGDNNDFRRGRERMDRKLKKRNRRHGLEVRNMTWKDAHCGALLIKPDLNAQNIQNRMEQLSNEIQTVKDDLLWILGDLGVDIATDALAAYGQRALVRQGAAAFCGPGALVCTGAAAAVNIISGLWSAWGALDELSSVRGILEQQLERLHAIQGRATQIVEAMDDPAAQTQLRRQMLDEMEQAVAADPCIQARRCFLVPYKNEERQLPNFETSTSGRNSSGRSNRGLFDRGPFNLADSRGCCPGQTGHHVLPDSWLRAPGGGSCTNGYNKDDAPVACLEGTGNREGSHRQAHDSIERLIDQNGTGPTSMSNAIDMATEAYTADGAPGEDCNPDCIREQLEDYYADKGCSPVITNTRSGARPTGPSTPSTGGAIG